jgi:hypothetical protein
VRLPNGHHFCFSRSFEHTLAAQAKMGYTVTSVAVHFIVYWRSAKTGGEHKVVLPVVTMGKQ